MNSEQILQADILDIIFNNRNKAYGAYDLRKFYHNRVAKSLAWMMIIAFAFSVFFLLPVEKPRPSEDIIVKPGYIPPVIAQPESKKNTPKKNQHQKAQPIQMKPSRSRIEIVDHKPETIIPAIMDEPESFVEPVVDIGSGGNASGSSIAAALSNTSTEETVVKPDLTRVYHHVDILPSFPGGNEALFKFLRDNLVTPADLEPGEEVTVKVSFIVGYDGVLKGFEVIQDGGALFNREVLRVLGKMPKWIPGKTAGNNVSVYFNIPVKFLTR